MFRTSIVALALLSAASVNGSGTIKFGSSTEHITVRASGGSGRYPFKTVADCAGAAAEYCFRGAFGKFRAPRLQVFHHHADSLLDGRSSGSR